MSAPARILMTADATLGAFAHAATLARALAARGVRVTLAVMGRELAEAQRALVAGAPEIEIAESAFRLEWMDDPWDDVLRAGEWLRAIEDRCRPDLVQIQGYAHASLPFRAPVVVAARSCALSWWSAVVGDPVDVRGSGSASGPPVPPRWRRYREEVARGLWAARAVVAPTQAMLDALIRHYHAPARTAVIPGGADPDRHRPDEKEPCVLAVGRVWDAGANLGALAHAARDLPWPVYVAGGRPEAPWKRSHPALVHLGVLAPDDLARALARASIYAFPARYEPFGLTILEAALAGCALVLGDIPSLREVWGDAAIFVSPDDPDALGRALRALVEDPMTRARMGACARARGRLYTPERMARAYLDLYAEVLRDAPHPTPRLTVSAA